MDITDLATLNLWVIFTLSKRMNEIMTDARCKIIWGDRPESVKEYLKEKNIPDEKADDIIQSLLKERYSEVKKNGIRKMSDLVAITHLFSSFK